MESVLFYVPQSALRLLVRNTCIFPWTDKAITVSGVVEEAVTLIVRAIEAGGQLDNGQNEGLTLNRWDLAPHVVS
jgi:hypothetical protein